MSGGGPSQTTSTVTQSNLPSYAKPYYQALMDRGLTESQQPYTPYTGQRLAGESDATQQGLTQMSNYASSGTPLLNAATGVAGSVANQALNSSYDPTTITAQNVSTGTFDQNAANQYMSPYINDVITSSQRDAVKNAQIEQAQRNLQSAQSGSFGGSRAAVQNQMAANNLQQNLSDIYTSGMQSAFENAQSQFNTDQSRSLSAQTANQEANLNAQQATEASKQFGANYGLQALGLAKDSASQLADLQNQSDSAALQRAQAQLGVGQTQEDYQQQQLDQAYQDFVNQRDSEKQNLQFLSSLLQGVPVSANSDVSSTNSSSQNNLAGALGSLGGLQALYALGKTS